MGDLCLLVLVCGLAGVPQDRAMTANEITAAIEKDMRGQALLREPNMPVMPPRNYEAAGVVSAARLRHKVPKEAQKAYDRATKFAKQKKNEETIRALEDAVALDPEFANAYNNLGVWYFFAGRADDAEAALRRAIALDAAFSSAYINLGVVAFSRGDLMEAERLARKSLALSPRSVEAERLLNETLRRAR